MEIHTEAVCMRILNDNVKCLNQEFLRVDQGDRNELCRTMGSAGENVHHLLLVFHNWEQGLNNQKLCLNLCSFSALNCKRSLVKYQAPIMS